MSGYRGRGGRGSPVAARGGRGGARGGRGAARGGAMGQRVVAVVNTAGGSLSERFAKVRAQATTLGVTSRVNRSFETTQRVSASRSAGFAANRRGRGGPAPAVVSPRGARGGRGGRGGVNVRITGKLAANTGRGGRGGQRGARGARGGRGAAPARGRGGRGGAKPVAAPAPSVQDMDMELEVYRNKGGE